MPRDYCLGRGFRFNPSFIQANRESFYFHYTLIGFNLRCYYGHVMSFLFPLDSHINCCFIYLPSIFSHSLFFISFTSFEFYFLFTWSIVCIGCQLLTLVLHNLVCLYNFSFFLVLLYSLLLWPVLLIHLAAVKTKAE